MADVERIDRYTVEIDGHRMRATEAQEARMRLMDDETIERLLAITGADR